MAFPDEAKCVGCLGFDFRDALARCHCCGAELTNQVTAVVLLKRSRHLRAVASFCEICEAWLPPRALPLRWGPSPAPRPTDAAPQPYGPSTTRAPTGGDR